LGGARVKRGSLINASNLHSGGGVQVATSFVAELATLESVACRVDVAASTEVHRNLEQIACRVSAFRTYDVVDTYGIGQLWSGLAKRLREYDVVFTVFGPLYAWRQPFVSVVGFAQAWIAYPHNEVYANLGVLRRWFTRLKFTLQAIFFRRADRLVVEAPHVRDQLLALGWRHPIDVVPNCLSGIYRQLESWLPVHVPASCGLKLGVVCRDFPHKNLSVFPEVKRLLAGDYGVEADFYVTLTPEEWRARSDEFRAHVVNVGALSVAQCPSFYCELDGVVFPSLLECSSVTPLEALCVGVPLFASDRDFVRDVCGGAAIYFEPTDPRNIAAAIAGFFSNQARAHPCPAVAPEYTDPAGRARRYVEILRGYAAL
jgi:glycosyltransferase involved in cell wall biosynthesis